jgi:hypothetical protein
VVSDLSSEMFDESLRAADARGRFRSLLLFAVAALLVVLTFYHGLALWDRFPERVPVHFGPGGLPDGWAQKSFFSIFFPVIIFAVVVALLSITLFINPKWCNFPGKERMLQLPLHHQQHVVGPVREGTAWLAAGVALGLTHLCRQAWAVALGDQERVSSWLMVLSVAVGILAVIIGIICARARIRSLEEAS